MAGTQTLLTGNVTARSGTTLMARIRGANGSLITQASLTSIAYVVSNLTTGSTGSSNALTVSSVVYDNLQQNDPRWTRDNENNPGPDGSYGYNFLATLPATEFAVSTLDSTEDDPVPAAPKYQVDVIFTPASGQPWRVVWQLVPIQVYG